MSDFLILTKQNLNIQILKDSLKDRDYRIFYDSETFLDEFSVAYDRVKLLFIDADFSEISALDIVIKVRQIYKFSPCLLFSEYMSAKNVVHALKNGVLDYISLLDSEYKCKLTIDNALSARLNKNSSLSFHSKNVESLTTSVLLLFDLLEGRLDFDLTESLRIEGVKNKFHKWKTLVRQKMDTRSILIIEDEVLYNDMLYDILSKEYDVYSVFDGSSAVEICQNERFDLVLLDLFLPDTSGEALLEKILAIDPNLPVIVITAFDLVDKAIDVIKLGAFDFLNKPVQKDDLLMTIDHALRIKENQNLFSMLRNNFFETILLDDEKLTLLFFLMDYSVRTNSKLTMKDLFLFYPHLSELNISDEIALPANISKENLEEFITGLSKNMHLQNQLKKMF